MSNSFLTPWTVTCQAPLSMRFPRQEYWSGLSFPSPGESSQPKSRTRAALQVDSLPLSHLGHLMSQASPTCYHMGKLCFLSLHLWALQVNRFWILKGDKPASEHSKSLMELSTMSAIWELWTWCQGTNRQWEDLHHIRCSRGWESGFGGL